ncbi:MAG: radical SAM family heme chaperone HemW [Bacteroidia bacterium]|nr:radical SAM family heme chaperone HemW [Bacteroidia bacterium]
MAGLYFHIPFCRQACNYCDFHFSTVLKDKENVLKAMLLELENRKNYLSTNELSSIYFGGGTPSLLREEEINQFIQTALLYFKLSPDAEITFEVNPDDVNASALSLWQRAGINRLSIGIQSFNNEELKWMKRQHSQEDSVEAVRLAQSIGFSNISIDLIYGSKFQNLNSWEETLDRAISLNPAHVSAYNLTIEQKTELGLKHKRGLEPGIDDQLSVEQFKRMRKKLLDAGYVHYEISNFAKPGFKAKHNSAYWKQEPYLGIGPSAHSFDLNSRQWNYANNARYCKTIEAGEAHYESEVLSIKERYNEYVLTGLRTSGGCNVQWIEGSFGEIFKNHFETSANKKKGVFKIENGVYSLNEDGLLQADAIASDLFLL